MAVNNHGRKKMNVILNFENLGIWGTTAFLVIGFIGMAIYIHGVKKK